MYSEIIFGPMQLIRDGHKHLVRRFSTVRFLAEQLIHSSGAPSPPVGTPSEAAPNLTRSSPSITSGLMLHCDFKSLSTF